jgi:dienelactone hydrolase
MIRFPSPLPSGDPANDCVSMEWYRPFRQRSASVPAMLVVHESGANMAIGRLFARAFQAEGFHAFLIHLPSYGDRRGRVSFRSGKIGAIMRQAIGDVRRARDAIAVLPGVDASNIGVQGTSLGGFVVATAASLDRAFRSVFIMLAGGDLHHVISKGQRDAAYLRYELAAAGYQGDTLKDLLWPIEPTRLAHRLDADRTWMFTAKADRVVPAASADALSRAIDLPESHHIFVDANHYTAILHFATIVRQASEHHRRRQASAESSFNSECRV